MVHETYFSKFFESIKPRKKNKQPIQPYTSPQSHKINFTWIIDELDFHIMKKEFLKSCKFSAITNDESKWRLVCLPYDKLHNSDDHILIALFLFFIPAPTDVKSVAKCDICFLNSQQKKIYRTRYAIPHCNINMGYCLSDIRVKKSHILPGNKLTIQCHLTYSISNKNNTPTPAPPHQLVCERLEKFAKLYRKDEFKDVLISVNGKNYLADKATLAAYSPVIASIIKAKEKKGRIIQVKIPNVSEEVFGEMLTYINTGKLSVENNATDLFILAQEFGIKGLQIQVFNFMEQKYEWRIGE